MKKIAVMCLLASLILSSGQVTAMAQPWDNVENMETVQQNITDAQRDIISESDTGIRKIRRMQERMNS